MARDKKEEEENYGGMADYMLSFFGITEENMESVKSILNSIKTVEYRDRTEIQIDMKKIKITITK